MRILIASFIALAASPALAEQAAMPQLDPTWFASQLFWLAISFALLYLVVSTFIGPRVGSVLEAREKAITEAITLAEQFKREANETKGNFESVIVEAKAKAAQIMTDAQAEVAKKAAAANDKLSGELESKLIAHDAELRKAAVRAQAGIEAAAADLAKAMAEQLLGEKIDAAQVRNVMNAREKAA
jgi:F-type H+-transporting ATPase subunit b